MTRHVRPIVAADDGWRLVGDNPELAQEKLESLGPFGDQLGAALNDQIGVLRAVVDSKIGDGDIEHHQGPAPTWVAAAVRTWREGRFQMCHHLEGKKGPQPLWLLAWDPAVAGCTDCMIDAQGDTNGTDEDYTCDHCRQHIIMLTPTAVTFGNLSVLGGLCEDCLPKTKTPV